MKKEVFYLITVVSVLLVVVFFIANNKPSTVPTTTIDTPNTSPSVTLTETPLLISPTITGEEMKKKVLGSTKKQWSTPPAMSIDTKKTYTATLKTTQGDIVIALEAKNAPITVNNFVFLSRENFYNNVIFHRIIKGFMIQTGDPDGTGRGGPGYRFDDEPFTGEYTRGTVAMANAGENTNGSQFFIMHGDTPLPKSYVIFGHVTSGLDVVDKIANAPVLESGEGSTPVKPDSITAVNITEE